MSGLCLILSGAPECYIPKSCRNADFVIACDRGYAHALRHGVTPNLVIGDFDSYDGHIAMGLEVIRTVPEKDDTDTMMGLKEAIARGYRRIVVVGGLGGRIDHTLANIQLLSFAADYGVMCQLVDEHHQIFALRNTTCSLKKGQWKNVSVFAADTEVYGVTLEGFKYPLDDATLTCNTPLGVSNEFAQDVARITVGGGTVIVVLTDQA